MGFSNGNFFCPKIMTPDVGFQRSDKQSVKTSPRYKTPCMVNHRVICIKNALGDVSLLAGRKCYGERKETRTAISLLTEFFQSSEKAKPFNRPFILTSSVITGQILHWEALWVCQRRSPSSQRGIFSPSSVGYF